MSHPSCLLQKRINPTASAFPSRPYFQRPLVVSYSSSLDFFCCVSVWFPELDESQRDRVNINLILHFLFLFCTRNQPLVPFKDKEIKPFRADMTCPRLPNRDIAGQESGPKPTNSPVRPCISVKNGLLWQTHSVQVFH